MFEGVGARAQLASVVTRVRLFAAAAEAAGGGERMVTAATAGDVRAALGDHSEDARRVIAQCALLRDGTRLEDDANVGADDVIDVLPPFAGG